MITSQKSLRKN